MLAEELIKYKGICHLQAFKNTTDLNFLSLKDLDNIQQYAIELKINIKDFDLEEFKYAKTDELHMIFNIWSNEINLLETKMREQIIDNYGD